MKFESFKSTDNKESKEEPLAIGQLKEGEKPDAFARKIELLIRATFSNVETIGEENLTSIPPNRRVIFVTTHITNSDVPLALSSLGQKFHLTVGDASTNHDFSKNPLGFIGDTLAGKENFMPVSRRTDEHLAAGSVGVFNPDDFENMKSVFDDGKAVVLPAYYIDRNKDLSLPRKGGYGAAYLAETSNAIIVPVAINIKSKESINTPLSGIKAVLNRPKAEVIIGEPFELDKIENISAIKEVMDKRKQGPLSSEDTATFKATANGLRDQSDILMQHLAELLPEEKKGKWSKQNPS